MFNQHDNKFLGHWQVDRATYCFYDPSRCLPLSCSQWARALKYAKRRRPLGHPRGIPENRDLANSRHDCRAHRDNATYSFANRGHHGARNYGDTWAGMDFQHLPPVMVNDDCEVTVAGHWVHENNAHGEELREWNQQLLVGPIEDPRFAGLVGVNPASAQPAAAAPASVPPAAAPPVAAQPVPPAFV